MTLVSILVALATFVLPLGTHLVLRDATIPYLRVSITLFDILALTVVSLAPHALKELFTRHPRVIAFVALFELLALLSLFWSSDWRATVSGWLHLVVFVQWMAVVVFERRAALTGFVAGAVVQASVGLVQFFTQAAPRLPFLGSALHDPTTLGTSVVGTTDGRWLRAYGTLPHPNVLGGLLVVAITLVLLALFNDAVTRRLRPYAFATLPILTAGLVVTFSRAAWLALIVCIAMVAFAALRSRSRNAGVAVATVGVTGALFVALLWPLIATRVLGDGRLETLSYRGREQAAEQAYALIREYPFRGVGYRAATAALKEQYQNVSDYELQPAHNVFLLAFSEMGFFGVAALMAVLYAFASRRPRSLNGVALVAALIVLALFDHWLFSLEVGVAIWWTTLAFLFVIPAKAGIQSVWIPSRARDDIQGDKKGPPPEDPVEVKEGGSR